VGSCETPSRAKGVYVCGDYAYVAASGLSIIDITKPESPNQTGYIDSLNCPPKFVPPVMLVFRCYNRHHQRVERALKEADDVCKTKKCWSAGPDL